ncbi:MAG TPA: hypothetical protein VID04_05415, partial [Methylomirabilota bacterium]
MARNVSVTVRPLRAPAARIDSLWVDTWRRFRRHRLATIGAVLLLVMVVAVLAGPFLYRV